MSDIPTIGSTTVFQRVLLDEITLAASTPVAPPVLQANADQIQLAVQDVGHQLIASMIARVPGKIQHAIEYRTVECTSQEPASWWQAFKLSAIGDGNPFFDPAKVRMATRRHRMRVELQHQRHLVWPDAPLQMRRYGEPVIYTMPGEITEARAL